MDKKQYEYAILFLNELMKKDEFKDNPGLYIDRTVAMALIGRKEDAKRDFLKAISIDSNCIDAYLNLGNFYMMEKDYKNAFYFYNIAKINLS